MPELPEVETVRRGLSEYVVGQRILRVEVRRRDLRQPVPTEFERLVTGRRIVSVARRAKYLQLHLEGEKVILVHLGMSGRLIVRAPGQYPPQTHDHVQMTLDSGEMVFNDARRFGLMTLAEASALGTHPLFAALGPEPFSDMFSPAYLAEKLAQRRGPVKPVLMDQALVVGVGNIYASEALFRAGLHPQTPAHRCAPHAPALVEQVRAVLQEAIASGGSTLRDYAKASGESGYFQHKFQVYGREGAPCHACHSPVARITQAGRSTFFCPTCQEALRAGRRRG